MNANIMDAANALAPQLSALRRDFHRYPEQGWMEFRTASLVAERLSQLGFSVQLGKAVVSECTRMGVPDAQTLDEALARARTQGAVERWLPALEGALPALWVRWIRSAWGQPRRSVSTLMPCQSLSPARVITVLTKRASTRSIKAPCTPAAMMAIPPSGWAWRNC